MEPHDDILEIFRADAQEHLNVLNEFLLSVEDNPSEVASFDEVFRAIHTLKGDSRMLGLNAIGEISHKIEDMLKACKSGKLAWKDQVLSLLFESAMVIGHSIYVEHPKEKEIQNLLQKMDKLFQPSPSKKLMGKLSLLLGDVPSKKAPKQEKPSLSKDLSKPSDLALPTPQKEPLEKKHTSLFSLGKGSVDKIRVSPSSLDDILNVVGELKINKEKITSLYHQFGNQINSFSPKKEPAEFEEWNKQNKALLEEFYENTNDYNQLTEELQSQILEIRMLPVETILKEYPLLVRNISKELSKKIILKIKGENTQLDKQLLETIRPALSHLIRNSIDHGIESPEIRVHHHKRKEGTIQIHAYQKGNHVYLEIQDDGAGIDSNKIKKIALQKKIISEEKIKTLTESEIFDLILTPGFSTKKMITNLSGRGIGLDVVSNTVKNMKGTIQISSEFGKFTKFTIQLPMTLAIMRVLLVVCNQEIIAIPLSSIQENYILYDSQIQKEGGLHTFKMRGIYLPLIDLSTTLKFSKITKRQEKYLVVIVKHNQRKIGLIVNKFLREQEIVIKNVGDFLKGFPFVSGATILRKGNPAIILNIHDLFQRIQNHQIREGSFEEQHSRRAPEILVVDDSITVRTIQKNVLEGGGYSVDTASSAEEALQKAENKLYDLVVTDVEMGGMTGFDLTEKLRADFRYQDIPIIIMTSLSKEEDRKRGIQVGAQAYIVKSNYDQKVILETIFSLIGRES